jgi:thioredoxin-related protein
LKFVRPVLMITLIAVSAAAFGADGWYQTWNSARSAAKKRSRPLIVMFVKNGCPECETMLANTKSSAVRSALRSAVKAQIEVDENPDLVYTYQITGTPTLLLFSAETGYDEYIYRETGAMSESSLVTLGQTVDSLCEPTPKPAARKSSAKPKSSGGSGKSSSGAGDPQYQQSAQYQYQYQYPQQQQGTAQRYYPQAQPGQTYYSW